jgi:hypothetical protein
MESKIEELLKSVGACETAAKWAATQPSAEVAWRDCERADWMLWIAAKLLPRELVVQAACDCAETSIGLIRDPNTQAIAILCIHVMREWAEGLEDLDTVCAVRAFADAAAYAAYATTGATTDASDATAAANASSDAAAYEAVREQALAHMADLVRARIPFTAFVGVLP